MSESVIGKADGIVKSYQTEINEELSLTVERYAAAYRLQAADLAVLGLKTTEDGIAIPYRDRDGQQVNERLLCSLHRPSRAKRTEGRAPGLYGLDSLPAMGAPLFLVVGEPSCHTLWHYGIDAIAVPTAYDFDPERDDRDIEGFDLTVLLDPGQDGDVLIERLSPSRHRYDIRVGRLSVLAAHADRGELLAPLAAAKESAEPLDVVLMANPELDRLTYPERIEIQVKAGERPRVVDETIVVIQQSGRLYERGGELVRLCQQTAIPVDEAWLGDFLSRRIAFFRCKSSKENEGELIRFEVDPPSWLAKVINAKRGERGLHELAGVITAPTLRPDGGLLTSPGFDEATGLLLRPGRWPKVPLDPDRDALHAAWQTLWMPVKEFPYAANADRGVTAAAQLTAIVRRILPKAPAFSFDAPLAGSGKTLLATCIAELAGGAIAAVPECREEDELRKRLLAALRDAQPTLLLDNIKGHFASSALEAFLTDDYYSDRVLSASQMLRLPTNVLVLISGNNFIPRGDLWRRILTARIDPKVESVERRCFELEPRKYCRENRQKLVAAGLTLLRGFIAAGMPRSTPDRLASFEEWDNLVRQCVLWIAAQGIAELGDPTLSIAKAKEMEPERAKLGAFLQATRAVMGAGADARRWRTNDLVQHANDMVTQEQRELRDILIEIAGERNSINPRILGRWIERQTDARCGGLHVRRVGERQRAVLWQIHEDGGPTGA